MPQNLDPSAGRPDSCMCGPDSCTFCGAVRFEGQWVLSDPTRKAAHCPETSSKHTISPHADWKPPPPALDVAFGRRGGAQEAAARWIADIYAPLGVRIYYATDTQGQFGRLVIPTSELANVIGALKLKHTRFGIWLEGVAHTMNAAGAVEPS
jgi:hypothetical protein